MFSLIVCFIRPTFKLKKKNTFSLFLSNLLVRRFYSCRMTKWYGPIVLTEDYENMTPYAWNNMQFNQAKLELRTNSLCFFLLTHRVSPGWSQNNFIRLVFTLSCIWSRNVIQNSLLSSDHKIRPICLCSFDYSTPMSRNSLERFSSFDIQRRI